MPRGNAEQAKVHYKGNSDDYIVFVDDLETYERWKGGKGDKTIPLSHFVSAFKVFATHNQGAQGHLDTASKIELSAEFDTEDVEEAIKVILEKGSVQQGEMNPKHPGRGGDRNETQGPRQAH